MDVRLSKPLVVGDKKLSTTRTVPAAGEKPEASYEVLVLDLEKLTGSDVDFCVREAAAAKGEHVRVLAIDHELHLQLAAKASGIEPPALKKLSAPDYVEVVTTVQAFLTGSA